MYDYSSIFGKTILSTVVRTQKIRCTNIPNIKNSPKVKRKGVSKYHEIPYATIIVARISSIAKS